MLLLLLKLAAAPLLPIDFINCSHEPAEKWSRIHGPHSIEDVAQGLNGIVTPRLPSAGSFPRHQALLNLNALMETDATASGAEARTVATNLLVT